jgi:hypothetical protein
MERNEVSPAASLRTGLDQQARSVPLKHSLGPPSSMARTTKAGSSFKLSIPSRVGIVLADSTHRFKAGQIRQIDINDRHVRPFRLISAVPRLSSTAVARVRGGCRHTMRLSECCGRKQQADRRATLERQMMFDATATAMEKLFDPRATWSVEVAEGPRVGAIVFSWRRCAPYPKGG